MSPKPKVFRVLRMDTIMSSDSFWAFWVEEVPSGTLALVVDNEVGGRSLGVGDKIICLRARTTRDRYNERYLKITEWVYPDELEKND